MAAFLVRRFAEAIPVVLLATLVIFLGMRLIAGDPALVLAGQDASPETLEAIRQANGLNQPLPVQYVIWLNNAIHADFGVSFFTRAPVAQLIAQRAPATLELGLAAMFLTVLLSLPTGVIAAVRHHRPIDWLVSSFNGLAVAVPSFWLGILAILLFSLLLGWLPPGGRGDLLRDPGLELKFLVLPAFTLALPGVAAVSRLVKSSMLEVLGDDYVRPGGRHRCRVSGSAPSRPIPAGGRCSATAARIFARRRSMACGLGWHSRSCWWRSTFSQMRYATLSTLGS